MANSYECIRASIVSDREGLVNPKHDDQENLSGAGLAWSKAVK